MNLDEYKHISKKKLGLIYGKDRSIFRLWAPEKKAVTLCLYRNYQDLRPDKYEMEKAEDGVFEVELNGDYKDLFYTYLIDNLEITDPYSFASSINSKKSAIVDLEETNPEGFKGHKLPRNNWKKAIIYETSIKDFTGNISSSNYHRGKFLGMVERNTAFRGVKTGLDHLIELGITHVHLLPFSDFISVDEDSIYDFDSNNYNWGYDQELYNVPEGAYSIDPINPKSRIIEAKMMIQKLHENGISVVMDVVYNHSYKTKDSNFNTIFPDYYYRKVGNIFSNGSGVGNEFASERPMVRKFIIDSLKYWASEFKLDGFRFDLMALTDIETIDLAVEELRKINPNILIYGEPWMALGSSLNEKRQVLWGRQNSKNFALFNAEFRDAIKGDNDGYQRGFIQGDFHLRKSIEKGIVGSVNYDDDHRGALKFSYESINYFNSHDNLILQDKLFNTLGDKDLIKKASKLAFGIIFTSQGIPFFHAGNEFLRSKNGFKNTYNKPLSINGLHWDNKRENFDVFSYVKDLISLRKEYPHFAIENTDEIRKKIKFIDIEKFGTILYIIKGDKEDLLISHNGEWKDSILKKGDLEKNMNLSSELDIIHIFSETGRIEERIDGDLVLGAISTDIFKLKKEI